MRAGAPVMQRQGGGQGRGQESERQRTDARERKQRQGCRNQRGGSHPWADAVGCERALEQAPDEGVDGGYAQDRGHNSAQIHQLKNDQSGKPLVDGPYRVSGAKGEWIGIGEFASAGDEATVVEMDPEVGVQRLGGGQRGNGHYRGGGGRVYASTDVGGHLFGGLRQRRHGPDS